MELIEEGQMIPDLLDPDDPDHWSHSGADYDGSAAAIATVRAAKLKGENIPAKEQKS